LNLIDQLKKHEGYRKFPYLCPAWRLTIGYGYNLDKGMDEATAQILLKWEVARLQMDLSKIIPFWNKLSQPRQDVLTNMAYNLGVSGLLQFRKMLEAAKRGNVESVCDEMKNSKWFNQVGDRAEELIEQYRRG
jgi:lysozyme